MPTNPQEKPLQELALAALAANGFWWQPESDEVTWLTDVTPIFADGHQPKTIEGWLLLVSFEDRRRFRDFFKNLRTSGDKSILTFRMINNGITSYYQMHAGSQTADENGSGSSQIYGLCWDVSDKFASHHQVERDKLRSEKIAKTAILAEVAAGIAHEINNPLAVISGTVTLLGQMLANPDLDRQRAENLVQRLDRTAQKIVEIIKGVKKLSTYDGDRPPQRSSLSQAVEDAKILVNDRLRNYEVAFELNLAEDAYFGHPNEMCQVLVNLFVNAIDAVKCLDQKWLKVSSTKIGDDIEIRITDSGSGIAEFIQQRIFEPFFTTKESGSGTGLGLGISASMIRNMNGKLTIDNDAANTTFVLTLPTRSPRPVIVFIDDEVDLCDIFADEFESPDYDIRTFSNPDEGLRFINESHPNLIFVDYFMPDLNGLDIATQTFQRHIPTYIVTGTPQEIEDLCRGSIHVMEKPLDRDDILQVINKHMPKAIKDQAS